MSDVTMKLDEILQNVRKKPEFYRTGRNLTEDEKRVISFESMWEISFINSIPADVANALECAFTKIDRKHYMHFQMKEWFEKQRYLLTQKLGRPPTHAESMEDAEKNRNYQRYPLCYVLNFPTMVVFNQKVLVPSDTRVRCFLDGATELHPNHYPYHQIISDNTARHSTGR